MTYRATYQPKDWQRSKVYAAENAAFLSDRPFFKSNEDVQVFVDKMIKSAWFLGGSSPPGQSGCYATTAGRGHTGTTTAVPLTSNSQAVIGGGRGRWYSTKSDTRSRRGIRAGCWRPGLERALTWSVATSRTTGTGPDCSAGSTACSGFPHTSAAVKTRAL